MATTINKKINHMYILMERLAGGEELYAQDEALTEALEINERTLRRYLEDIHTLYGHIVLTEKKEKEFSERKVTIYRVVDKKRDVAEIFRFFIENRSDLSWIVQLIYENDPHVFEDVHDKQILEENVRRDQDVFLFVNNPFEQWNDEESSKIFAMAKTAVKNREYRTIRYRYDEDEVIADAKCLKIVFMNNNWYLAVEENEGRFRFLRLAFVEKIEYSQKTAYQSKVLDRYAEFFRTLQNAMTIDGPGQTALLQASAGVSRYFQPSMKPFFPSQEFLRTHDDGTVEFTIDYTQPMEILPFVKQWQPDLTILEPESLREALRRDLHKSLENHSK
jgi:predicted DNA-binding transcriptional regulator YafY